MYAVSDTFLAALRESHKIVTRLDAYIGASVIAADIPISGGQVTVNSGSGVRRTLDVTITDRSLWSTLDTVGVDIRAYRGVRYPSGTTESVPLGIFSLDNMSMSVGPTGGIEINGIPDRWAKVQRAQFEQPTASVATNRISVEIGRLVTTAVASVTFRNYATATDTVGPLIWDQDRSAAAIDLATSIGAEAYFDNVGQIIVADAPLLGQVPVWSVDASASGVLISGSRIRDRQRTYNVVVAYPSSVSGSAPYAPVVVADTDPTSRTYVNGAFGRVPFRYTSPAMTTSGQATVAATALLNRVKAVNAQLNVEAVVNPALDRGDVITVLTPDGTSELHLIDSVTIPLSVDGTQQITTRSSRPEGDVPAGE